MEPYRVSKHFQRHVEPFLLNHRKQLCEGEQRPSEKGDGSSPPARPRPLPGSPGRARHPPPSRVSTLTSTSDPASSRSAHLLQSPPWALQTPPRPPSTAPRPAHRGRGLCTLQLGMVTPGTRTLDPRDQQNRNPQEDAVSPPTGRLPAPRGSPPRYICVRPSSRPGPLQTGRWLL